MQPFFTTNEADIPQLEGLYIMERSPPAVIAGANFSTIGMIGQAVRGPVDTPVAITTPSRFAEVFGGRDFGNGGPVVSDLWRMILNKPFGQIMAVRAAPAAAAVATVTLSQGGVTAIAHVNASSAGSWGNAITVDVTAPSSGTTGQFNLVVHYQGRTVTYRNVDFTGTNDNSLIVLGTDYGNLVTITKIAAGTPDNVTAVPLAGGTDGTIADTDYTAPGRGLNVIAGQKGLGGIISGRMSAAVKGTMYTLAPNLTSGFFVMSPDNETVALAAAEAEAATYRSDRVIYAFNHAYTLDPTTATEIVTPPSDWMASILSQTDVDIHPGDVDNERITQGITRLYNESYQRNDYIALKNAGIAALEHDGGFSFVSGITTLLDPTREEITRRRMTDFLQISIASYLKNSVKKKNTPTRRAANTAVISQFLRTLQRNERVVDTPADGSPGFKVDPDSLNTALTRAQGIEKIYTQVRLISHMLEVVLVTQIGTTVTVTAQ